MSKAPQSIPVSDVAVPETPETPTTPAPVASSVTTFDPLVSGLISRINSSEVSDGQGMVRHHVQCVGVTKAELQAAIAANPNHPIAHEFSKGIANLPDAAEIAVEQPDLQALLHNRTVETRTQVVDGRRIRTKRVV